METLEIETSIGTSKLSVLIDVPGEESIMLSKEQAIELNLKLTKWLLEGIEV